MKLMEPRWDLSNRRWECSIGSGKNRTWFRCKIEGNEGKEVCRNKRDAFLLGPAPLVPGSLAEFIETVWWPRTKPNCTRETLRRYKGILERYIDPFYSSQVEELRLEVLQPWVNSLEASPKSVANIYGVLSGILELARKTGRYSRLDHKLVAMPRIKRVQKESIGFGPVAKIIQAAAGSALEGPVWVAATLGLRRNEVCGLKVGHITFRGEYASIRVQDNRQPFGETQKLKSKPEGEPRILTVPKWIGEKLLSFAEPDSIYLFCDNGGPIHPNKLTCGMPGLCKAANVPQIRFHDLRHACRSNLEAMGVRDVDIMAILGHSTYQASLGYQGLRREEMAEGIGKIAGNQVDA